MLRCVHTHTQQFALLCELALVPRFSLLILPLQCEWLLGDRKPSPEDLDKGIDINSPLFQAILENPVVQLGLTNPKTLLGKRSTVHRTLPVHSRHKGTILVFDVFERPTV